MTRQLKRELCRRCAMLLAAALLLRAAVRWGPALRERWTALAATEGYRAFFYYLNTGQVLQPQTTGGTAASPAASEPEAEERELPVLRFRDLPAEEPPQVPAGSSAPLSFTAEEAAAITVGGNCTLDYDKEALLLAPLDAPPVTDGPQVLIVHTHSTEAYTIEPGWEYEETEPCRTLDPDHSVLRLGQEIAAILEDRGIAVLHDTTINDYPAYTGAYDRMAATIQAYLDAYPSIRMVLDVHRDAFENADGTQGGTAEDGRARVMLVVGTNQGGLDHPNWQGNLSFALKLEALLNREYPDLTRGISLCTQRYNQNLTPLSLLAEFGAAGDTLDEALAAARDFAVSLAELLAAI